MVSLLFRLGGSGRFKFLGLFNPKLWRWLGIGMFLTYYYGIKYHDPTYMLCILAYWIATNIISYGETHPLRKLTGKDLQWLLYGFCFGLASWPVLGYLSTIQAVIACVSFWILMKLSSINKLDHKYVELAFGFIGTVMYIWK